MLTRRTLFQTVAALAAAALVPPAFLLAGKAKTSPKGGKSWKISRQYWRHDYPVSQSKANKAPVLTEQVLNDVLGTLHKRHQYSLEVVPDTLYVAPAYLASLHEHEQGLPPPDKTPGAVVPPEYLAPVEFRFLGRKIMIEPSNAAHGNEILMVTKQYQHKRGADKPQEFGLFFVDLQKTSWTVEHKYPIFQSKVNNVPPPFTEVILNRAARQATEAEARAFYNLKGATHA